MSKNTFSFLDYVIFVFVLLISAGIGIFYRFTGGKQKTAKEYLIADGRMSVLPVAFSLMASFMSAITLLGVSAENYYYGCQFALINLAYLIGSPIAAFVYLPVFYKLQCYSTFEYLERRFGRPTRLAASLFFVVQMILYMSLVLYAPALALNAVTNLPEWLSILSVGLVCTFYSTIGGMKAVLWTDVFQSVLMFAAMFAVIASGVYDSGGVVNVLDIAQKGERLEFFTLDVDPTKRHTLWTQMIGGVWTYTSIFAVNQGQVQRLLSCRDLKSAQLSLFVSLPILVILSLSTVFSGIVMYAKYSNCDPLTTHQISSTDQLLPRYVMDNLSYLPGMGGLFVSGVFSGALSTVSSALNALAAVTFEDFVRPLMPLAKDDRKADMLKIIALTFGLACVGLAFVAGQFGGILQASLMIFNVVGGPLLALYTLGMLCPRANQNGALAGFFSGLSVSFWISIGAWVTKPFNPKKPLSQECNYTEIHTMTPYLARFQLVESTSQPSNEDIFYIYRISYMWVGALAFFIAILVGLLISALTGGNECSVHRSLLSPLVQPKGSYMPNEQVAPNDDLRMKIATTNCPNSDSPTKRHLIAVDGL